MMLLTFFRQLHPSTRRADPEDHKTSLLIDVDECLSDHATLLSDAGELG